MNNDERQAKDNENKIKDFQIKMQVLKNAVIEERNKRSELEKEINKLKDTLQQHEDTLHDKELAVIQLSNEKFELQSALEIERNKSEYNNMSFTDLLGGIFQKKESITYQDSKFLLELKELRLDNDMLKKKIEEQTNDFENCKSEYQNLLNTQMTKVRTLESALVEKNKLIDENNKKLEIMFENYKKYDIEKTKYNSIINKITEENNLKSEKIIELLNKLEDKENVINTYKESFVRHEIESTELAKKLAELKNAIIESNMIIQSFTGEKIGTLFNTPIEVMI